MWTGWCDACHASLAVDKINVNLLFSERARARHSHRLAARAVTDEALRFDASVEK
jgi:hypothetical protein